MSRIENTKPQRPPLSSLSRTGSHRSLMKKGQSATKVGSLIALFSNADKSNCSSLHLNDKENIKGDEVRSDISDAGETTEAVLANQNLTRCGKLKKSRRRLGARLQKKKDEKKRSSTTKGLRYSQNHRAENKNPVVERREDLSIPFDCISSSSSALNTNVCDNLEISFEHGSIENSNYSKVIMSSCDQIDLSPIRKIRGSPIIVRVVKREIPENAQPSVLPRKPGIEIAKAEPEIAKEDAEEKNKTEQQVVFEALRNIRGALKRHEDLSKSGSQQRRVMIRDENNTIRIFTRTKEEEEQFGRERGRKLVMRRFKGKDESTGSAYSAPLPDSPQGLKDSCVGMVEENLREVEKTGFELGKQILFLADDWMPQCAKISMIGNENSGNGTWSRSALKLSETLKKSSEHLNAAFNANCGSPTGVEGIFTEGNCPDAFFSETIDLERSMSDPTGQTIRGLDAHTHDDKVLLVKVIEGATETEILLRETDHFSIKEKANDGRTKPTLERALTYPDIDLKPTKINIDRKLDVVKGAKRWNKALSEPDEECQEMCSGAIICEKNDKEDEEEAFFKERTRKHLSSQVELL